MGLFAFRRMQEREAAAKAVASAPKPAETKAPRKRKRVKANGDLNRDNSQQLDREQLHIAE